jgi:hypothetical protein
VKRRLGGSCEMAASQLTQLVEGWQLSRAVQGRLRRDGAVIELTVDKGSIAGYSPDSSDVSAGSCRISSVRIRC